MAGASRNALAVEIGIRIGRLRTLRGWSQEKLGQEAGIKASQISKIEQGDALPRITTLMDICAALNAGYDEILPAGPGIKTETDPGLLELDRALEGLPDGQRDQIISTALAAAKYYKGK